MSVGVDVSVAVVVPVSVAVSVPVSVAALVSVAVVVSVAVGEDAGSATAPKWPTRLLAVWASAAWRQQRPAEEIVDALVTR